VPVEISESDAADDISAAMGLAESDTVDDTYVTALELTAGPSLELAAIGSFELDMTDAVDLAWTSVELNDKYAAELVSTPLNNEVTANVEMDVDDSTSLKLAKIGALDNTNSAVVDTDRSDPVEDGGTNVIV